MSKPLPIAHHHHRDVIVLPLLAAAAIAIAIIASSASFPTAAAFATSATAHHRHRPRVANIDNYDATSARYRYRSYRSSSTGRGNYGSSSSPSAAMRLQARWNWNANDDSAVAVVADAKSLIEEKIADTNRGRSMRESDRPAVRSLLSDLESLCAVSAPARDARMEGPWIVLYTDAPPPSNGRLGFLEGIAKQVIDLNEGTYRNELYVGGDGADGDENAWLSAILDARWYEWDGVYLDDPAADDDGSGGGTAVAAAEKDPGATTWKVDFESITLSLFGASIFTQRFEAGTSRTWRMSYLDDDTRIVRAGRTGRGEDDWIFYMRRGASAAEGGDGGRT